MLWLSFSGALAVFVGHLIYRAFETSIGRWLQPMTDRLLARHKTMLVAVLLGGSALMLAQGLWQLTIFGLMLLGFVVYVILSWRKIGDSFRLGSRIVPIRILLALLVPILPLALFSADFTTRPPPKPLVVVLPPLPRSHTGKTVSEMPEALRDTVDYAVRKGVEWAWSADPNVAVYRSASWKTLGTSFATGPTGLPETLGKVGVRGRIAYVAEPIMTFSEHDITIHRHSYLTDAKDQFIPSTKPREAKTVAAEWGSLAAALAGIAFSTDALDDGAGAQLQDSDKRDYAKRNEEALFQLVTEGPDGPIQACLKRQFTPAPPPAVEGTLQYCETLDCLSDLRVRLENVLDHDSHKGLPPEVISSSISPQLGIDMPIATPAPECGNG